MKNMRWKEIRFLQISFGLLMSEMNSCWIFFLFFNKWTSKRFGAASVELLFRHNCYIHLTTLQHSLLINLVNFLRSLIMNVSRIYWFKNVEENIDVKLTWTSMLDFRWKKHLLLPISKKNMREKKKFIQLVISSITSNLMYLLNSLIEQWCSFNGIACICKESAYILLIRSLFYAAVHAAMIQKHI